jgi:hypothetical protein
MFKKIRSLVFSCDKILFTWLEGRPPTDKPTQSGGERSPLKGSVKSRSSVENAGNKIQIRDPWD